MKPTELAKNLFLHMKGNTSQIYHYTGLLSLYGALQTAEVSGDEELMEDAKAHLALFPDGITHARYNHPSYRIGGIPRAYALYKGLMTDTETERVVHEAAEEFLTVPKDRHGLVKSPYEKKIELTWIDNAMAVTPLMLFAGLQFNDKRYLDEAALQAIEAAEFFRDPENGLLHQCCGFLAPGVITPDHWGRGNGWGYIALTELLAYLPESHPDRLKAEETFGKLSYALLCHRGQDRVWHQEMCNEDSYAEASGTALTLYGFGVGLRLGYLRKQIFGAAYRESIEAMCKTFLTRDYRIKNVCPGCLCPRTGTVRDYMQWLPVTDDLHGCGPVMLALTEAERNGITDVTVADK